jgi:diadenosine tetraphosphatase ApaH/serine/threonine PP2A family protein phosphatase
MPPKTVPGARISFISSAILASLIIPTNESEREIKVPDLQRRYCPSDAADLQFTPDPDSLTLVDYANPYPPERSVVPTAVISDIHGNAAALKNVLADIKSKGIDKIVCLGDIVGYGPEPLECVDLVQEHCQWALMGNHDFGVLYEPTNFNKVAEDAAYWTREQFDAEPDETKRAQRYAFLGSLRVRVVEDLCEDQTPILAVHASPRRPINEYIFPDDVTDAPDKMEAIFDRVDRVALVGHTHVPGVFSNEPDFYPPSEIGDEPIFKFIADEKAVINVGSVGQPRDHDPRASYVLLSPGQVEFCRVEYDIKETAEKIKAIAALNDWLGDRLYEGR